MIKWKKNDFAVVADVKTKSLNIVLMVYESAFNKENSFDVEVELFDKFGSSLEFLNDIDIIGLEKAKKQSIKMAKKIANDEIKKSKEYYKLIEMLED